MAELTKLKTGSVGPQGEMIFDVFAGEEYIKDPTDPRLKGIDIASLPDRPQAPTGFQSQFLPVKLDIADKIPAEVLEDKTTRTDIQVKLEESFAKQEAAREELRKSFESQMQALAPTEEELGRQQRLTALREAQTRSIESVEERGAILRGGLESEIQNILQGRTTLSLPNIREQRLLALQLGNDLAARQIKVDQAKIAAEMGKFDFQALLDLQDKIFDFDEKVQERNDKLPERQKGLIESITTQYAGLDWNDLDPATQRTLTENSAKLGISVQSIQTNLKNEKNKIELDNAKKRADIARTRQLTQEVGEDEDEIDSFARRVNSGEIKLSNVPSAIRGRVSIKAKEFVGDELREEIVLGQTQGFNREQIIDSLVPAYPEFSKKEIRDQVFDLIPDKPQEEQPEKEGYFGGFFKRLFGF